MQAAPGHNAALIYLYRDLRKEEAVFLNLNTARPGLIMFGARVVRCETHELSMDCAVLAVADPQDLPDTFNLIVSCAGMVMHCRVVWRELRRVGVSFHDEASAPATSNDPTLVPDIPSQSETRNVDATTCGSLIQSSSQTN